LRQGGLLSLFLFILGVDVLSCIMKLAYEWGFVQKWDLGIWGFCVCDILMILSFYFLQT